MKRDDDCVRMLNNGLRGFWSRRLAWFLVEFAPGCTGKQESDESEDGERDEGHDENGHGCASVRILNRHDRELGDQNHAFG